MLAIGTLLDLPFDLYATFRIEQRFGFNRMTWRLYLADAAEGQAARRIAIGVPLAALLLWIMAASRPLVVAVGVARLDRPSTCSRWCSCRP